MIHGTKTRYWKATLVFTVIVFAFSCSDRQSYVRTADDRTAIRVDAININTASAGELEKIPQIGRKTAEAIVRFREENGPFRRAEHLLQIRGISEKRFFEIRQYLRTE